MFMLCVFADRMYWPSCIEPLLYPKGCSFYRPFSYREDYITQSLLSVFKDVHQLEKFLSDESLNRGIFSMRFKDDKEPKYRGIFIPLRLIMLTSVRIKDTIQLKFQLGDYVKLSPVMKLQAFSLDGLIDYMKDEYMLLIDVPRKKMELFASLKYQSDFPAKLWDRFADDESISLVAKENFIGVTVLRLDKISERGKTTPIVPKLISNNKKSESEYGFELRSGRIYDFDFAYSRIIPPKQSMPHVKFDYAFNSPIEHFNVSRDRIAITGNYREELVWIQPKVGSPGPTLLEWIGMSKTEKGKSADPKEDKVFEFRLPVKLLERLWPCERIINAILTGIFFVSTGVFVYFAFEAESPQISHIWTALGVICAGIFGGYLRDTLRGRSRSKSDS